MCAATFRMQNVGAGVHQSFAAAAVAADGVSSRFTWGVWSASKGRKGRGSWRRPKFDLERVPAWVVQERLDILIASILDGAIGVERADTVVSPEVGLLRLERLFLDVSELLELVLGASPDEEGDAPDQMPPLILGHTEIEGSADEDLVEIIDIEDLIEPPRPSEEWQSWSDQLLKYANVLSWAGLGAGVLVWAWLGGVSTWLGAGGSLGALIGSLGLGFLPMLTFFFALVAVIVLIAGICAIVAGLFRRKEKKAREAQGDDEPSDEDVTLSGDLDGGSWAGPFIVLLSGVLRWVEQRHWTSMSLFDSLKLHIGSDDPRLLYGEVLGEGLDPGGLADFVSWIDSMFDQMQSLTMTPMLAWPAPK